ncbi:MAG TPA: hypothetical protein DGG94_18235, partial [Micromonosporaceae bacterium]|nr:hypothetical protein [Micromonosporaceae bacterium]
MAQQETERIAAIYADELVARHLLPLGGGRILLEKEGGAALLRLDLLGLGLDLRALAGVLLLLRLLLGAGHLGCAGVGGETAVALQLAQVGLDVAVRGAAQACVD